jgi:hypothetical protein
MLGSLPCAALVAPKLPSLRGRRRGSLLLEELESRTLLATYGPSQILHAYGFDQLPYDGTGQTIAIVDAYGNPNVSYDLSTFDQYFGIPDPTLTIAYAGGKPFGNNASWALETDLDVQWAHAIAPGANILLVVAQSSSLNDMMSAVAYAAQQPGVVVVSMSWGSQEFASETPSDSYFTTPPGHLGGSGLPGGVTFVAASGDTGGQVNWPAASPNVLSVGGTTLTLDGNNNIVSETGWSQSGGGVSSYEPEPSYQVLFQSSGMRSTPDVAYSADASSAYWVYDTYGPYGGLQAVYGTSAGAPQWAGLVALADEGLALNNMSSLDGPTQTLPTLYNLANLSYSTYYNDIVDGNNGSPAGAGYDLVTGLGSPIASQLVPGLISSIPAPGGGARGPEPLGLHLFAATTVAQPTPSPLPPPTMHGNAVAQPNALLLADLGRLASGSVPAISEAIPFSPTMIHAGSDRTAAVFLLQPSPAADSRSAGSRIESGGGDNAVLVDDSDDDGLGDTVSRLPSDSTASGARARVAPVPAHDTAGAPRWRQAADACFAAEGTGGRLGVCQATFLSETQLLGVPPDPLAAVGVLALALGGYWNRRSRKSVAAEQRLATMLVFA